ncbi:MAG: cysteine hydrolase [Bauldia sp.]
MGRLVGSRHWAWARRLAIFAVFGLSAAPLAGQTIIEEWTRIQAPPAPTIGPVELTARTTALLVLDFTRQACSERVPRCLSVVPNVEKLLRTARASGALIVYSHQPNATANDIDQRLAALPGDPIVAGGPDKFIGTNLARLLKDHGIETVIVTGVRANGAVLFTGGEAALNGYNVVVPVDGMASLTAYEEQFTAFNLVNAPGMQKVKLATTGGISFR